MLVMTVKEWSLLPIKERLSKIEGFIDIENSYQKIIDALKTNKTEALSKVESLLSEINALKVRISEVEGGD